MHKLYVDRVVDGDTFVARVLLEENHPLLQASTCTVLHRRIRLHFVDTPEKRGTYLEEEEQLAQAIQELLEAIFASAKELHFEPKLRPDNFGRLIGEVWVTDSGGTYALSEFLLDNHLAKLYDSDPQPWWTYAECLTGINLCQELLENISP